MGRIIFYMISKTDFKTINKIWTEQLWPNRVSKIEPHSAMLLNKTYDIKNFDYDATYFLYHVDGKIAGCNSGHKCTDNTYRSRGLYVFPEYRKQGIGKHLLVATIQQGKEENCDLVWSYPRFESWTTYKSAGFELISDWAESETGLNAYCQYKF
jgi:GNAT superfamily N-acetyltransferase